MLGSGLTYEPGDSLGVMPENCPELVQETLAALSATGEEPITVGDSPQQPLRQWLRREVALNRVQRATLDCSWPSSAVDPTEADAIVALEPHDLDDFLGLGRMC